MTMMFHRLQLQQQHTAMCVRLPLCRRWTSHAARPPGINCSISDNKHFLIISQQHQHHPLPLLSSICRHLSSLHSSLRRFHSTALSPPFCVSLSAAVASPASSCKKHHCQQAVLIHNTSSQDQPLKSSSQVSKSLVPVINGNTLQNFLSTRTNAHPTDFFGNLE